MNQSSFLPSELFARAAIDFCTASMIDFSTPLPFGLDTGSAAWLSLCRDIVYTRSPWACLNGVSFHASEPKGPWPVILSFSCVPPAGPQLPRSVVLGYTLTASIGLFCHSCRKRDIMDSPPSCEPLTPWLCALRCRRCSSFLWPWSLSGDGTVPPPVNLLSFPNLSRKESPNAESH